MKWTLNTFEQFSNLELFEYLKLRQDVFVVEQTCPYPDIDDTDLAAHHLLAYDQKKLVACARLIPAGLTYFQPSIGRIATHHEYRGSGLGRQLVARSIEHLRQLYPAQAIKIGAQEHLEKFYQSYGFIKVSEAKLEDGIPHIDMLLEP